MLRQRCRHQQNRMRHSHKQNRMHRIPCRRHNQNRNHSPHRNGKLNLPCQNWIQDPQRLHQDPKSRQKAQPQFPQMTDNNFTYRSRKRRKKGIKQPNRETAVEKMTVERLRNRKGRHRSSLLSGRTLQRQQTKKKWKAKQKRKEKQEASYCPVLSSFVS